MNHLTLSVQEYGFAIVESVLDALTVCQLREAMAEVEATEARALGGIRNLLEIAPVVGAIADSETVHRLVTPILGEKAFVVRGIYFDKRPEANWKVPWHQDLTLAVQEKRETPGFGPWSIKAGIPHVQAPASFLEQMLAVRLHLDDCDAANGPLRVLPGTHLAGRLSPDQIRQYREEKEEISCLVGSGGAILMRPLLLHASSPAKSPRHRRVLHLEFAAQELPAGLQWHRAGTSIGITSGQASL